MDLIDDLGNDLVLAFLVERKHRQKIDSKDVSVFIARIKAALRFRDKPSDRTADAFAAEQDPRQH